MFPITQNVSQTKYVLSEFSPVSELYGSNYLNGYCSGRGNTGIAAENGISGILFNPAGFSLNKNTELNVQYTLKTTQIDHSFPGSSNSTYNQNLYFSGTAAVGFKVNKNFNIGFSHSNPTSYLYDYKDVTLLSGSGTDAYSRLHTHSFRLPVSFVTEKFSLGVSLQYNIYVLQSHYMITTLEYPDGLSDASQTAKGFNLQIGAIYRPTRSFAIGFTVTNRFTGDVQDDFTSQAIMSIYKFVADYPLHGGVGFTFQLPKSNVKLYADYNYINMNCIPGYQDWHNVNIGADFPVNKKLTLRGGVFTYLIQARNELGVVWTIDPKRLNQIFLTAGATLKVGKNSEITASLLDSHIAGDIYKNTYLNAGYSVGF